MKFMIASDLHGSAKYCRVMLEEFEKSGSQKLILLGDLLYHGPRNGLCEGYDPKAVADMLNRCAGRIVCVKGNCDSEVDQMVLSFPIMSEQAVIYNGVTALAIHGHKDMGTLPLGGVDVLFSGHTHVPTNFIQDGILFANPGSVSIPKENTPRGYVIWEDRRLSWHCLDGRIYDRREL